VSGSGREQTSEGKIPWMPAGWNKPVRYGNEARRGRKNPGRADSWTSRPSDGEGEPVSDDRWENGPTARMAWKPPEKHVPCRCIEGKRNLRKGRRRRSAPVRGCQEIAGESQRSSDGKRIRPEHRANDSSARRGGAQDRTVATTTKTLSWPHGSPRKTSNARISRPKAIGEEAIRQASTQLPHVVEGQGNHRS